jgi:glutamyl-tRNA reductase
VAHLLLLGVSHHTAPIELRERIDFAGDVLGEAVSGLAARPSLDEAVILSTCNRAELYTACPDIDRGRATLVEFLTGFHSVPVELLRPHLYTRVDEEAARHLFRVASGLDSLVVGEPQILGQVKDAYSTAGDKQATGPLLNKLFHWSFAVGKRVRATTGLAEGAVSVSYAAVALARKIFGDLRGLNVLLVGVGEMGKLTAQHLKAQHVRQIAMTSRTAAHAESVAEALGATALPWAGLEAALLTSDIVVTATGAATPIFSRAQIDLAIQARRNRPLFVIDIAVPRDVDPAAGEIEQVFLYNIDDLRAIVRENLSRRGAEVERAEAIVLEEVQAFGAWLRSREAIPTVVALRQRFEAIRQAELQRLEPKLAGLPPEARARVDEVTRLIVEKLLLSPTEQLKALSDRNTVLVYSDALTRLFRLGLVEEVGLEDLDTAPDHLPPPRRSSLPS